MDALTLFNVALAVVNLAVGLFQGWKEWHAHRTEPPILHVVQIHPHPLEAALRDVAMAIRGRELEE